MLYAEAALREFAERYSIVECAFDPWRFGAQALDLQRQGLRMVQFPQHDSRLVPASERLSAAILERRLRHPENQPELARLVGWLQRAPASAAGG